MDDDVIFQGVKLKRYRLYAGFSRIELADLAGIARDSIRRFETGMMQPRPSVALKISKILEVDIRDLYTAERTSEAIAS